MADGSEAEGSASDSRMMSGHPKLVDHSLAGAARLKSPTMRFTSNLKLMV
jgi:hypothetical protein